MLVCKQTPRKNVQVVNRSGENTASDNLVSTLTFTQRDPPLKNAGYALLLVRYSCYYCGVSVPFQKQPWHLGSCCVPTLDLWLNFDSSICIITPGPPNCGIGWRSSASHATSRYFRANLTKTFRDAIPSISITFKESLCAHFQRQCICLPKEILLPAKYEFALTEDARRHRRHLLLNLYYKIFVIEAFRNLSVCLSVCLYVCIFMYSWRKFLIFPKHLAGKIWVKYSPNVSINIMYVASEPHRPPTIHTVETSPEKSPPL